MRQHLEVTVNFNQQCDVRIIFTEIILILILIQNVSRYTKAWFPQGDNFLEIEIKTIATFISRRQQHFQGDIFISPNKFLSPTHSHQTDIITKLRRKNYFVKKKRWHTDLVHCFWHHQLPPPDISTSFSFVCRWEGNFFKLFQSCSTTLPFSRSSSLAISFQALCFTSSFLKSFSYLLYKQGYIFTSSDSCS